MIPVYALLCLALSARPGMPGPESRADYRIEATLLPESSTVRCRASISFIPAFPADTLWLHLYPNAYRDPSTAFGDDQSTMGDYGFARASTDEYGWIGLDGWTLDGDGIEVNVDETLGFIPLGRTVQPGDTLELEGDFTVRVPIIWSRMGHDGDHYEMTQWYPKMCVLDDEGWHTSRYRSDGEFYSDYGEYTVSLTLPDSFVTAATGSVDTTVFSPDSTMRTEVWTASQVHDFAWVADPAFELIEHDFIPPAEAAAPAVRIHVAVKECDAEKWEEVGAWADSTLLYCGEWYGWYPYGDLWIVQSASWGGMEYPQLVLIGNYDSPFHRYFEMVVVHEIGHQWFYGMLGNNEVDEAWLDEGVNSFSEIRYFERKYGLRGNMTPLPDWVSEYSDADETSSSYVSMVYSGEEVPVLSASTDAAGGRYDYGALYYSKPALFMRMLQNQAGEEPFDFFMHEYCRRFTFHHPGTEDFQAVLEETTGRSWQEEFDVWLRTTESADPRVECVSWPGDSTAVTVSGDIPVAVELDLGLYRSGSSLMTRIGLEPGRSSTITVPGRWFRAEIDPETRYLDSRPWNNSLPAAGTVRPLFAPLDQPSRFNTWLAPIPGHAGGEWEAGLYGIMHSARNQSGGPLEVSGFWKRPLTGRRSGSWGLSVEVPLEGSPTGGGSVTAGMGSACGRERVSLSASRSFHGFYPSDPWRSVWAYAGFESVSDASVVGEDEFDEGYGVVLRAGASTYSRGMSSTRMASLGAGGSPGWGDGDGWFSISFTGTLRLPCVPLEPRTRLFAGRAWGDVPTQYGYRPGGGLDVDGTLGWLLPPDGWASTRERYFVEDGPSLPGYGDSGRHGRIGIGLGETLQIPAVPLFLFADAGLVEDSAEDLSFSAVFSDAGIGLDWAFLKAWFPVWVSDPRPGDDCWKMRWRFAFSLWGLVSLLR